MENLGHVGGYTVQLWLWVECKGSTPRSWLDGYNIAQISLLYILELWNGEGTWALMWSMFLISSKMKGCRWELLSGWCGSGLGHCFICTSATRRDDNGPHWCTKHFGTRNGEDTPLVLEPPYKVPKWLIINGNMLSRWCGDGLGQ